MAHWAREILNDTMWSQHNHKPYMVDGLNRMVEFVERSEIYQFRLCEIESIANNVSVCDNLTELSELIWTAATTVGFQHFSIFVLNQGCSPAFSSRMCTSHGLKWLKRYQDRSYQLVDPVLLKASSCSGSFTFAQTAASCPLVQDFWLDCQEYKIGQNGVCFVIDRPNGARIGVSFSTMHNEEKADEIIRLNGHDLLVLSELAVECFTYLSAGDTLKADTLSDDELRFLHILATSPNPEKALLQRPMFGGNKSLQASVRKKLNVDSVFQAVSIASALHWFDNLPVYTDEVISVSPELTGWAIFDKADTDVISESTLVAG